MLPSELMGLNPKKFRQLNSLVNNKKFLNGLVANVGSILFFLKKQKLLTQNGIIILHRHKSEDNKSLQNIKILEMKKYGISKIFFISLN